MNGIIAGIRILLAIGAIALFSIPAIGVWALCKWEITIWVWVTFIVFEVAGLYQAYQYFFNKNKKINFMSKQVKQQGEAEKVALAVFAIPAIAAVVALFFAFPIWVKFFNLVLGGGGLFLMAYVNRKSVISEGLMAVVWLVIVALMVWMSFSNYAH